MKSPAPSHSQSTEEVVAAFHTSTRGLTDGEARRRLDQYGPNELPQAEGTTPWAILAAQFKNVLIIILLIATVLSAFLGEVLESIVIAIIVLFAILLGFVQEFRAERAMEGLRRMTAPMATVLRGGHEHEIPSRELVPGDLILIAAGSRIPADGRLIEAASLKLNEAALTGEGSVAKNDEGEKRFGYRFSQIAARPKFLSIRRTSPMMPS